MPKRFVSRWKQRTFLMTDTDDQTGFHSFVKALKLQKKSSKVPINSSVRARCVNKMGKKGEGRSQLHDSVCRAGHETCSPKLINRSDFSARCRLVVFTKAQLQSWAYYTFPFYPQINLRVFQRLYKTSRDASAPSFIGLECLVDSSFVSVRIKPISL